MDLSEKKKIAWLDTIRVFASFAVIVGHYMTCFDNFTGFDNMRFIFFPAGNIGVFVFFILSGYLIPASLERSKSLWDFYRKKLIRVVVPFTVTYVVLGAILMLIGLLQPSIAMFSPFQHAIYQSGTPWGIIFAMFPVDVNLFKFFDWPLAWFVGEWFMGVLLFLFLIAPLLNKMIRRAPIATLAVSIVIATATFYAFEDLALQGRIVTPWWFPIARIPEFVFGMILFTYKDFLKTHRKKLLPVAEIWTVIVGVIFYISYADLPCPTIIFRLFPIEPRSLLIVLSATYLIFEFANWLNEKFPKPLACFNDFSDISYMAMIIQHVVLNIFSHEFDFEEFHTIGPPVMFVLIVIMIVYGSQVLKKFSDPVEQWLMKRK